MNGYKTRQVKQLVLAGVAAGAMAFGMYKGGVFSDHDKPKIECRMKDINGAAAARLSLIFCKNLTRDEASQLLWYCDERTLADVVMHICGFRYNERGEEIAKSTQIQEEIMDMAMQRLVGNKDVLSYVSVLEALEDIASWSLCDPKLREQAVDELIRRKALIQLARLDGCCPYRCREKIRAAIHAIVSEESESEKR